MYSAFLETKRLWQRGAMALPEHSSVFRLESRGPTLGKGFRLVRTYKCGFGEVVVLLRGVGGFLCSSVDVKKNFSLLVITLRKKKVRKD
jgi:hypothetical protein